MAHTFSKTHGPTLQNGSLCAGSRLLLLGRSILLHSSLPVTRLDNMLPFNSLMQQLWQWQLQSQCQHYIGTRACALIVMPALGGCHTLTSSLSTRCPDLSDTCPVVEVDQMSTHNTAAGLEQHY